MDNKTTTPVNGEVQTSGDEYRNASESNSVIGIKNGFSGEFHSNGLLRIDGDFSGVIKGRGVVLVGEKGRIVGDIYAKSVRIGGKVKGNVYAYQKMELLSTGKLLGDFYSQKFFAEEGMIFTGSGKTVNKDEIESIFARDVDTAQAVINEDF